MTCHKLAMVGGILTKRENTSVQRNPACRLDIVRGFTGSHEPKLRFINRLFWNAIHHLLGFPLPSAYNRSTSRAANS